MTIISAVLFGSQITGGSDQQSDKDLLIVCKLEHKKEAISKYSNLGYSVSVYTPSQLNGMRLRGSLFLQHLKHESQVMYDSDGIFSEFIGKCDLTPPSLEEINHSIESLINALRTPEKNSISWWLADYLFVLSRDYFIKYFARKGRVVFNVIQLAKEIEKEFNLKKTEAETFLALRKCKSIYRSGILIGVEVGQILSEWCDVLTKLLDIQPVIRLTTKTYLFDRNINEFETNYEYLRYIESLRIMFPKIRCKKEYEYHVVKMISNPNHYSSTSEKRKVFLSLYLMEFRKQANKCVNAGSQNFRGFYFAPATKILTAGYA